MSLLVLISFESKGREVGEPTVFSSGEEPLEESPKEAKGEELPQYPHLFPDAEKQHEVKKKKSENSRLASLK